MYFYKINVACLPGIVPVEKKHSRMLREICLRKVFLLKSDLVLVEECLL